MATKLGLPNSKEVIRETKFISRGRNVIMKIEANGTWLSFKEKGARAWYRVPIEKAFWEAVKIKAEENKQEKALKRKKL
jgi:hypothetical protein